MDAQSSIGSKNPDSPACPKCGQTESRRLRRTGLLQQTLFTWLNRFPWQCTACQETFMTGSRGKLKRRRNPAGEAHLPPV